MSGRKDWKRLHQTRTCKDDSTNRFPTPKGVVEGLLQRYGRVPFQRLIVKLNRRTHEE